MIAHKFSIGSKSGELPGHSKTLNLLSLKNFASFLMFGTAPNSVQNATAFRRSNSNSWKQIFGQNFFVFDGIHHSFDRD